MLNKELLLRKMEERGLNHHTLAKQIFVSQAMVTGIIHGYKQPSLALAVRMADVLGCSLDELVLRGI